MEVQNNKFSTINNVKPNFGSVKVDSLNLLKKVSNDTFTPVKATFSELIPDDAKDVEFVKKLKDAWKGATEYGTEICDGFLQKIKDSRFFVTEIVENGKKKVTNIMQLNFPKTRYANDVELKYLQSAPDIADKLSSAPIKGSGETAMYEIAKIAKNGNYDGISLMSTNDRFYEKIGMADLGSYDDHSLYGLAKNKLDWFMARIAKKYDLN